jgi:hypothetical protein
MNQHIESNSVESSSNNKLLDLMTLHKKILNNDFITK